MLSEQEKRPQYSVIVPVGQRVDDLPSLIDEYDRAFEASGAAYEIIVVLDGPKRNLVDPLRDIVARNESVKIVELSKSFGESAALMAGFSVARAELLVTLPAYHQVDGSEIPKLLASFGAEDDVLLAVRSPRAGSTFEQIRRGAFHGMFRYISGLNYRDLGCGVRLMRREVMVEIPLYGDQHRFLPALASRRGFRTREIPLAQSPHDRFRGHYRLREYLHRILDVLTVFFLVRFTKKPLRFFGTIGFVAAGIGGLFVLILVVQRLFFGVALADRPALLLASLLIVLGVQTFALGLIGELIIFTHASGMKEYAIRKIVQAPVAAARSEAASGAHAKSAAYME